MTEQIITKNLYSFIASGGGGKDANNVNAYLMPTSLTRYVIYSSEADWIQFHKPDVSLIPSHYVLYPTNYSKPLSQMTESELYAHDGQIAPTEMHCYEIKDNLTNLCSGIKWVSTYTNTGNKNVTINGVKLVLNYNDNSRSYVFNLVHAKFDAAITVPPAESYSFTLDLNNIFQTFPSTLAS